jgi:hypothetical protein
MIRRYDRHARVGPQDVSQYLSPFRPEVKVNVVQEQQWGVPRVARAIWSLARSDVVNGSPPLRSMLCPPFGDRATRLAGSTAPAPPRFRSGRGPDDGSALPGQWSRAL